MDNGYIKLWRVLLKKPIWIKSTPQQRSVLITLLLMANHEQAEWEWGGKKFSVMPGQFVTSLESIRKKAGMGISIQNVRSSLKRFKKLQFLTYESTKSGRLISIINWGDYQPLKQAGQQRGQQRGNKGATTNKNDKNNKNKKTYSAVLASIEKNKSHDFYKFYRKYPKKKSVGKAKEAWAKLESKNLLPNVDVILKTLSKLKETHAWKKNNGKYIPYPASWLNAQGWEDETKEDLKKCPHIAF